MASGINFSFSFQIAIAALHIACVMLGKENQKSWFAELNVDMDKVIITICIYMYKHTTKVLSPKG
jgi:hypothetical protein